MPRAPGHIRVVFVLEPTPLGCWFNRRFDNDQKENHNGPGLGSFSLPKQPVSFLLYGTLSRRLEGLRSCSAWTVASNTCFKYILRLLLLMTFLS